MKAKLIIVFIILSVGVVIGYWSISEKSYKLNLSELTLANMEALADNESGEYKPGYEASTHEWYSSLLDKWTTIPCCKNNGNPYSGCSAIDTCTN